MENRIKSHLNSDNVLKASGEPIKPIEDGGGLPGFFGSVMPDAKEEVYKDGDSLVSKRTANNAPTSFEGMMLKVEITAVCIDPSDHAAIKDPAALDVWLRENIQEAMRKAGFSMAEVKCFHKPQPPSFK